MRGRPLVIHWNESEEDLYGLLRRERNGHRRARYQALWMLRRGHNISEVSQTVGVDYRTVQRWVSWYRKDGLAAVIRRTPGYAAPGQPSRLNREQITQLMAKADTGSFRTVRDAMSWVEREFGVKYTYTGMHALLNRSAARFHQDSGGEFALSGPPVDLFERNTATATAIKD
jgi:transposase